MTSNGVSVPHWLDEKFFEKVLRTSQGDKNLTITDISVAPHINHGEHYASSIFRVTVRFANKFQSDAQTKLFVKLILPKVNAFLDEDSFDTELNMYISTLADMQRILSQNGEKVEFAPRLLFSAKEPVPLLVLEDATTHGYGLASGLPGLEGTKFVASKLAKFHAASLYLDQDNKDVQYYQNRGLFNLKQRDGLIFMKNNMKLFIEEIATWEGFESITERMKNLVADFDGRGAKAFEANVPGKGYNVLNHGDFHINNVLFKKDSDGKIKDVLFLDFQLTKWGPPSIDVVSLLYMIASQEALTEHRTEIIQHYYQEFVRTLKEVGFMSKVPGLLDLNIELLKNGFWEVVVGVCFLPAFFMDLREEDPVVFYQNNQQGESLRRMLYKHPQYKEIINKLVSEWLFKGWLD